MSNVTIGIGFGLWPFGLPRPEAICSYAERAEDLGIDSIWLADNFVSRLPALELSCVMATFAARTERIKMGPCILTLPARNPIEVAKTYASLDYLSGGSRRVIMAVGVGADPRDCKAVGVSPKERGVRLEEGVEVLRKLWSGPHVTHHGKFYQFDDVTIEPRPAGGPLDIWIGGQNERALQRVAKCGDGWFSSFLSPPEFARGVQQIVASAPQYGRSIDPDEAGVVIFSHVSRDPTRSQDALDGLCRDIGQQPEVVAERSAFGTPEECVAKIQTYVAAGCTKFVLWPIAPTNELNSQVEVYGKEIIPRFVRAS